MWIKLGVIHGIWFLKGHLIAIIWAFTNIYWDLRVVTLQQMKSKGCWVET
jgi:hypothetical protein